MRAPACSGVAGSWGPAQPSQPPGAPRPLALVAEHSALEVPVISGRSAYLAAET